MSKGNLDDVLLKISFDNIKKQEFISQEIEIPSTIILSTSEFLINMIYRPVLSFLSDVDNTF